jgi:hypothetical protein
LEKLTENLSILIKNIVLFEKPKGILRKLHMMNTFTRKKGKQKIRNLERIKIYLIKQGIFRIKKWGYNFGRLYDFPSLQEYL